MSRPLETDVVRFGGYEMACSRTGSGPPVVLLHSGGLSSRQWGRLGEQLAERHRVIAPDFIGYGRSSAWPASELFHFVLDALAVEALIDQIGEPVSLIGHSYGGFIAMLAALHRPQRVQSLATFEPVAFGVLHSARDPVGLESLVAAGLQHSLVEAVEGGGERWLQAFVDYWQGEGAWTRLSESARVSFRAVGWKLFGEARSLLLDRTPHQAYAALTVPTLIMRGDTSPIAARRVAAILAGAMTGAVLRTVEGAGHMAPLTHAQQVNGWVADHLPC